jgi:hypothetical protein
MDFEGEAGLGEKFAAAGRGRGEDQHIEIMAGGWAKAGAGEEGWRGAGRSHFGIFRSCGLRFVPIWALCQRKRGGELLLSN